MNFMMFRAWILLSALTDSFASLSKNSSVVFSSTVTSLRFSAPFFLFHTLLALIMLGSARRIAIIVGGIPAERRRTVLWDSVEILSSVRLSILAGRCVNNGTTSRRPTKTSKVSAVISIAPLCLN